MTTKNLGPAVSGYLNPDGRNWETVVFQAGKPVLDKELILGEDIDVGAGQLALTRAMPSGWLANEFLDTSDTANALFIAGSALEFSMPNLRAHVNGWILNVINTGASGMNRLTIPACPTGLGATRTDVVVLEVWRKLISASPSTDGKSFTGRIWANGNVKVASADDAVLNYADDILDAFVASESTKRVQIQYRLRVLEGVDILSYPSALDDPTVVARSTPTAAATPDGSATVFTYTNQAANGDAGLWRAGDGNPANTLATVDGYMYAIPLCGLFRRNTTPFDKNTNQNGGAADPGPSTRPDGLLADVIAVTDIVDLRLGVRPTGWDYSEILEKTVNLLFDNNLKTEYLLTSIGGGTVGHTVLYANEVGVLPGDAVITGDTPGADFIGQFDAVRRTFSDRAIYETVTVKVAAPGGGWVSGSTVAIDPTTMEIFPFASNNFAARAPAEVMFLDIVNATWIGPTAGKKTASAMTNITKVTGLGTRPIAPLSITVTGTLPTGLSDEPIYVEVLVGYPAGGGLTHTPVLDFGAASVSINNPLALPATTPVSYSALAHAFDYPHREIRMTYTTVTVSFSCAADTTITGATTFRLPERADSIVSVDRNGGPIVGTVSLDSTGRVVTFNNAADYTSPGDTIDVEYVALRPLPNNGEQVTIWYNARTPQTIRNSLLGTTATVVPRAISSHLWAMTVGSGSQDEAYPFPYQYVQTAGVYPTSAGTFSGEHEMMATSTIDIATFNADTGLLRLPIVLPFVPQPEAVTFMRAGGDIDAEDRTFFKSVPSGYIPNAYAQELSDAKKHKAIVPMIVELAADSTLGKRGQLMLVLLQRWIPFDEENFIAFNSDLTQNTTTASIFRLPGNLLNKRV